MLPIAQLIKLQDYISRYEWDTFRYPSQYIRLKKDHWKKLYDIWEDPEAYIEQESTKEEENQSSSTPFYKLKGKWKRTKELQITQQETGQKENLYVNLPDTEAELKQYFLNRLFHFQMKWASSTVTKKSYVNAEYYRDPLLKYLLQRFPDTYLVMYLPIFMIKKAPIETEILLISPIGIEIIHFVEKSVDTVIMAGDERTWTLKQKNEHSKLLNPLIALKRTEKLINSLLSAHSIDFPIHKTVLSRTNSIVFATEAYNTKIIGQENFDEWFEEKRKLTSPLKNVQLKAAEALLKHCQTTSVRRPEWEEDTAMESFVDIEQ